MAVTTYHYAGPGVLVGENRNGTQKAYRQDGWGSTSQMIDTNAPITDTFEFDYFGNQIARTGTTGTPFRWRSRRFRSDVLTFFAANPVYNSVLGRFLNSSQTTPVSTLQSDLPKCGDELGPFMGCIRAASRKDLNYLQHNLKEAEKWAKKYPCNPKAECKAILDRLKQIDGMISGGGNPDDNPNFRFWAITCCCKESDGSISSRTWFMFSPFYYDKGTNRFWPRSGDEVDRAKYPQSFCAWKCSFEHEKKHRDDLAANHADCNPSDARRIQLEQAAYKEEMKCLEKMLKDELGITNWRDGKCPEENCP